MPGPIESAYVDIVARLRFDQNNELTEGIRREVSKAEREFDKLENKASETGRLIASKLGDLRVQLNVRDAIGDVNRLGNAVEAAVGDLRVLSGQSIDLNTTEVKRNIDNLERSFKRLASEFRNVDGETITVNVATAEKRIIEVSVNVKKLLANLDAVSKKNISLDVAPAVAALRLVGERATTALRQVRAIGTEEVKVRVDDVGLPQLEARLHEVGREIDSLRGKPPIRPRTDPAELNDLEARTRSFGDTFERVGKRLIAFAVFGGITAGLSQLVSAGIQAAAQIETIQVSLDRMFKGFEAVGRQLGGTSSEFLKNLRELAITTPFQFADLGGISTKIVQLDTNLNKVADTTGKIPSRAEVAVGRLKNLADAAAGVGSTADDINGVVRAISQLAAKGKINLQDLNQIAERLPNFQRQLQIESIIDQLNKVRPGLHATVADFDTLRLKGLIPVNVAVDGLFEGLKKIPGAAGAAAAQARTLTGALSNLKDFATLEFADAFSAAGATIADSLNAAFSQVGERTPLADAVAEVISSAGIAVQKALPGILEFIEEISDKVADGVTAIGNLAESMASGFSGSLFTGTLVGLTNVVELLTAVNEILSHLPVAVGEGIGQFLVLSTVLSQLSGGKVNVLGLVVDQLKAIVVAAGQVIVSLIGVRTAAIAVDTAAMAGLAESAVGATVGVTGLRAALISLGTATVVLAAITAAFLAVQNFLGNQAKAAQWSKDFQGSINSATSSLKDFQNVTSATEDFVKKFVEAGDKVKLEGLSGLFSGLTTTELETNLGLTQGKFAELIGVIAEFGHSSTQAGQKAAELGLNMDNLEGSLGGKALRDTLVNTNKLAEAFAKGAPAAFDAAVAQKTFNFVTSDTTKKIVEATRGSKNYIKGLRDLQAANNLGAKSEFASAAALNNISVAQQRAILRTAEGKDGVIDYTKAVGDLREKLRNLDDALLDALDKPQALGAKFKTVRETFYGLTSGLIDGREGLLEFANAAGEAGLSAQELDSIALKLKTSLTGEELGKALAEIAADFTATLETLKTSLPAFSDAITAVFSKITLSEGVTGLKAVQEAFDQFSLDKFIKELNRVVEARANLIENLSALADLSTEAVRRLFELKLDPTQLAVVTKSLIEGGQKAVDAFLMPFNLSDALVALQGQNLVTKLVEAGIEPALLAAIPGLTDVIASTVDESLMQALQQITDSEGLAHDFEEFNRRVGFAIGESLGQGLVKGLESQQDEAKAAGAAVVDELVRSTKLTAQVFSPSKVFAEIGRDLSRGLAIGIKEAMGEPLAAMGATVGALVGAAVAPAAAGGGSGLTPSGTSSSVWTSGQTPGAPFSAVLAPEPVSITVDARGAGRDYWSGMEVGRGVVDQWQAYRLRFPKR